MKELMEVPCSLLYPFVWGCSGAVVGAAPIFFLP